MLRYDDLLSVLLARVLGYGHDLVAFRGFCHVLTSTRSQPPAGFPSRQRPWTAAERWLRLVVLRASPRMGNKSSNCKTAGPSLLLVNRMKAVRLAKASGSRKKRGGRALRPGLASRGGGGSSSPALRPGSTDSSEPAFTRRLHGPRVQTAQYGTRVTEHDGWQAKRRPSLRWHSPDWNRRGHDRVEHFLQSPLKLPIEITHL